MSYQLIEALQNKALYDHPVEYFKVIETHISWVILTGHFAYKIKKPVDFEFLDFSSLSKRRFYCHQEVRANQALSPDVCLAVIPITGSSEKPAFAGEGETIEYAIMMREFSQENLFDALLSRHELTSDLIDELAILLAAFHQRASRDVPDPSLGSPEQIYSFTEQNFQQVRELLDQKNNQQLDMLEQWMQSQWQRLSPVFAERKANGFVRECHGDVHLGNITLIHNKPVIFDCIEFNEGLRWTDTMADVGFLMMDLFDKKCDEYAHQFLSYYLEHCGDYQGLAVLPFYQVYRAMVRAKVALFKASQANEIEKKELLNQYQHYVNLAEALTRKQEKALFITYGLSGSGKSTVSQTMVRERGVIRLRSDIIRKQIHELNHFDKSNSGLNEKLYAPDATEKTYDKMLVLSKLIIESSYSVVVDAAFLLRNQRQRFSALAKELKVPEVILACAAPIKTLQARIELRQAVHRDPSEANLDVLEMQRKKQELLVGEELAKAIVVDAEDENRYQLLNEKVNQFLGNTART